jgi:integrase
MSPRCGFLATSPARPRPSPTATTPTCCAFPTAAAWPASAITPCCGVLGDCGLRSAELRGLRARDQRRPRSNARHYRLYVCGKGGREREVPVPLDTQAALEAWSAVHPLAHGVGLLDEHPLFVRLGRHGDEELLPLSAVAVHRIVRRSCPAPRPERVDDVADVLDRRHQVARRAGWGE